MIALSMEDYTITSAIKAAAARMGLKVAPSQSAKYKLDAFDEVTGEFVRSFGTRGSQDYHTYLRTHGADYAQKQRDAYHARHNAKIAKVRDDDGRYSRACQAAFILW